MTRAERRDTDRWQEQPDPRWPEPEPESRWPDDEGERWPEQPASRRRTGRLRVEIPPIVNPYAIVALVAALLGLFPVAIVFGFIAFSHPRGRVMAMFALLLGVAELTAVAGFVLLTGNWLPDVINRQAAVGPTPVASVPTTVERPVATTTPPAPSAALTGAPPAAGQGPVTKGSVCSEAQLGQIGTTTDGSTLICLTTAGGYQWSGPHTVATAVQQAGAKCDASGPKTGRTADGRAVVCEVSGRSGTWVLWTE
ncbi:hypothetical protein OHA40_01560 [Nocardia sp. NBC_00508]|uniref:DUF4190 domain-containing protein n=1 Tax=Nocardia sp. NBC_00508 TaxID=2975992 RepID=UPI002E816190|nr:DUF4190 domain-containing protein [Nocardia sp. NBC_00508]WUD66888.1 hypothetical protein OHA40_01560 [Nocardia sp. NBC_00508]